MMTGIVIGTSGDIGCACAAALEGAVRFDHARRARAGPAQWRYRRRDVGMRMTPPFTGGSPATGPLAAATKAQATYQELRRRILSGELEPGATLNQEAVAVDLGVSVTPVREAARRLEAEGLLQFEAHKLLLVAPLSRTEFNDLYDVRLQLDPHAAALATGRLTPAQLDEIEAMARARRSDPLGQLAANRAFHHAIYSGSGNRVLTETLDLLWERTDRYRAVLFRADIGITAALRQHMEIVNAIRSGNKRTVARLLRARPGGQDTDRVSLSATARVP